MILTFRVNDREKKMIDEILSSEFCQFENFAEWIRCLIHREWNKRKRLGVPKSQDFSTSFRAGNRVLGPRKRNTLRGSVLNKRNTSLVDQTNVADMPDRLFLQKLDEVSPSLSPLPVRASKGDKSTARRKQKMKGTQNA
ncbi:MAG TPA: hypothetical protein VHG71_06590 [Verrucomicrobiae bacterium]|nr:hypothetical protein [Verrucomicrobiae bacterium]